MDKTLLKLAKLPYFRTSHLEALLPYLKKPSLYQKVSRWIKSEKIFQLKKGFYVTREYRDKNVSDPYYFYYLANILRRPSYVSGACVLQNNDILTDITYPITSITVKTTRKYTNELGEYIYHSISPDLYIGYQRFFYKNEPVYAASLAKALFDYLYIKYFKIKTKPENIIMRERLNLEKFTKKDIREFKKYCKLSNCKNLTDLGLKIFEE